MNAPRQRLVTAERDAIAAQRALRANLQPWRQTLDAHRTAALLGGGFASGLALALLPIRWWSRAGALAFRLAAHTARMPLPFSIRSAGIGARRPSK